MRAVVESITIQCKVRYQAGTELRQLLYILILELHLYCQAIFLKHKISRSFGHGQSAGGSEIL